MQKNAKFFDLFCWAVAFKKYSVIFVIFGNMILPNVADSQQQ
jgi:hypothetical protein